MQSDVEAARLRKAAERVLEMEPGLRVTRNDPGPASWWDILARRLAELRDALDAAPSDDLGSAWRAAEEALPEGWVIWGLTRATKDDAPELDEHMVWAGSWRPSASVQVRGVGLTPTAALLALASRLKAR